MRRMFGAMPGLVDSVGDAARLGKACADLASQLSEQGVSLEEVGKYKPVLVASLRSLLPRSWDAQCRRAGRPQKHRLWTPAGSRFPPGARPISCFFQYAAL